MKQIKLRKKLRGFTLIELLAVIVVLAIILIIAVPAIGSIIKKSREDSITSDIKLMQSSARTYVNKTGDYNPEEGETEVIPLKVLINKNYISKVISPYDNKTECDGAVIVSKTDGKYSYKGYLNCGGNLSANIEEVYKELDKTVEKEAIEALKDNASLLPADNGSTILDIVTDLNIEVIDPMDPENNEVTGEVVVNNGTSIIEEAPVSGDTNTGTTATINGEEYQVISDIVVSDENANDIYADGSVIGGTTTPDDEEEEPSPEPEPILSFDASKGVNAPILADGMTPIVYSGSGNVWNETTPDDPNWYNYTSADKKWANATTADGSMWVWIPRYAYQIASGYHLVSAGTINIKFLKNDTNEATDGSTVTTVPTYSGSTQTNYILHPAFKFGDKEVQGMWVAKFDMTGNISAITSLPSKSSIRNQTVGAMFNASRGMETNESYGWGTTGNGLDTHMMKNTEWGAAAYLSKSIFGQNTQEVWTNPSSSFLTGCVGTSVSATSSSTCYGYFSSPNGPKGSTTGTVYGIYDMSGGAHEYVMANCNNTAGASELDPISIDDKYIDRYTGYNANTLGGAIYETSGSSSSSTAWFGDASREFCSGSYVWVLRGGTIIYGSESGLYHFVARTGSASTYNGFRVVIMVDNGL